MIDHDIPPPPSRNKYPWRSLEIGDSFHIKCGTEEGARAQAYNAAKRYGIVVRTCCEPGGGCRVWRVA